ncbi:hypothetical protein BH24ACT13_BH24ACT13_16470 [soil metagenome]
MPRTDKSASLKPLRPAPSPRPIQRRHRRRPLRTPQPPPLRRPPRRHIRQPQRSQQPRQRHRRIPLMPTRRRISPLSGNPQRQRITPIRQPTRLHQHLHLLNIQLVGSRHPRPQTTATGSEITRASHRHLPGSKLRGPNSEAAPRRYELELIMGTPPTPCPPPRTAPAPYFLDERKTLPRRYERVGTPWVPSPPPCACRGVIGAGAGSGTSRGVVVLGGRARRRRLLPRWRWRRGRRR